MPQNIMIPGELANKPENRFLIFLNFIEKHHKKILWLFIVSYLLIFSGFCFYKYFTFDYIGLDLSIFNQVFFNSANGDFFGLTIHPHSYLGDHFEITIVFLLPFYYIFKSPITLLFLQSAVLALSAYPLYLIAQKKLSKNLSLFIALFYLTNVFIHNINSYEFHILPFAILFLFFAFYYYLEDKFGLYLVFLGLSLFTREDVALVVIMLGFLAVIEKKGWKWFLVPFILGIAWFILTLKLTGYFSGYGQYKFILYYGWLGQDIKSILINAISNPWLVFRHIFSGHNLSFIIGLLLPFAFLVLLKIKYLLPTALIFFQIILLGASGALALEIHYTSLFIPFLFISLVFSLQKIFYKENKNKILRAFAREKMAFLIVLFLIGLYSSLTVGSVYSFTKDVFSYPEIKETTNLRRDMVEQIPCSSSAATGFHFLPALSSREKIYSLHYQYLGKEQYSNIDYRVPDDTDYLLFDLNDFVYYKFLYREYDEKNIEGAARMRELVNNDYGLQQYIGKFLLYQKNSTPKIADPYRILDMLPENAETVNINFGNKIYLAGLEENEYTNQEINGHSYKILPLTLYWQLNENTEYDFHLKFIIQKENQIYLEEVYPLSAFYPTHDFKPGEIVGVDYQLLIPEKIKEGKYQLNLSVYRAEGRMGLNKSKSFRPFVQEIEEFDEKNLLWIIL